jgi:hypothetical protein
MGPALDQLIHEPPHLFYVANKDTPRIVVTDLTTNVVTKFKPLLGYGCKFILCGNDKLDGHVGINNTHVLVGHSIVPIYNISKDTDGYKVYGKPSSWSGERKEIFSIRYCNNEWSFHLLYNGWWGWTIDNKESICTIVDTVEQVYKEYDQSFDKRYAAFKSGEN